MKNRLTIILLLLMLMASVTQVSAQVGMKGGRGLLRTLSADVVAPADIYVNAYFGMYFERIAKESLAKFYSFYINSTFGLSKNFELNMHMAPYVDDQVHIFGRLGNSELGLKYKTPFSGSRLQTGIYGFFIFPTAQEENVPYDVFFLDKAGWGAKALFTLDFSDASHRVPVKLHANIGYVDHDIEDEFFVSEADQMLFSAGIKFPVRSTQFFLEYSGEVFINNSDSIAFDENTSRISAGTRFLGPWGMTMDIAGDYGLNKRVPLSERNMYKKLYSKWRIWIGLTKRFSVYKYFDKRSKLARKKQEEELRKLKLIKEQRRKAEEEMKKMKDALKENEPEKDW